MFFVANVSRNFYDKYVSNYDSTNELGYTKHYDLDFVSTCMLDKLIEMHKPCYYDYMKEHQHLPLRVKITPEISNFMVSLGIDKFTELIKWIDLTPIKDKSPDKPHEFVSVSCGHISEQYFSPGALRFIEKLNSEQRNCVLQYLWCNQIPCDARGSRNARESDAMKILLYISGISRATYDTHICQYVIR